MHGTHSSWDDSRDEPFFRIVGHLVEAGSALLAANDPDAADAAPGARPSDPSA